MSANVRHVWDMHRPRDVSHCMTCLGHDWLRNVLV
ncbi:hypothetical protein F383_29878 [Gossypium arboreum]|uniref:Uncharacterized protein n=1 Tax=Gossypium arboreum TaxID=29729 RepID=A0A0B0MYB3_GOSAR|nr:hypothetical protein F383_29878 [Gossypium arboreum]